MDSTPPPRAAGHAGKIVFADQLRAVAALCVLITHLLGSYWVVSDVVAQHIFAPLPEGPPARIAKLISPSWFNFGPFGVSLFFLVSGFVIPFSLSQATRLRFLAARALRIYPTYVACLALSVAAIWLSARYWHRPFTLGWREILANAALVQNLMAVDSIDLVNWSLAVELKFYLAACLIAPWVRRGRVLALLLASAAAMAAILAQAYLLPAGWQQVTVPVTLHLAFLSHDLLFIPFMFVGTMFFYHFSGHISGKVLAGGIAMLYGMFCATLPHTLLKPFLFDIALNYFYALCLFAAAYALRRHWRPVRWMGWFASVSYPVYALHPMVGYSIIRCAIFFGVNYYAAVALAVAAVLVLAWLVHRAVELPTQTIGKGIMRRGSRPAAPVGMADAVVER